MKLLIIEKDEDMCELLSSCLEEMVNGIHVHRVNNLEEAAHNMKNVTYDVIILDHLTYRNAENGTRSFACKYLIVFSSVVDDRSGCLKGLPIKRFLRKPREILDLLTYLQNISDE